MAAGEDVAFEKALALVLGELLDDVAHGREVLVVGGVVVEVAVEPLLVRHLVAGLQAVGRRLVGAEDAEHVAVVVDELGGVLAQHAGCLGGTKAMAALLDVDRVLCRVGELEVLQEPAAVGVGVGAQAKLALGHELGDLGTDGALLVKEAVGLVGLEPALEDLEVGLGVAGGRQGHLVRTPGTLGLLAVNLLGAGPALGGAEDDHGVERAGRLAGGRTALDVADLVEDGLEERGKATVDGGVVLLVKAGDEVVRVVAHAAEELVALAVGDAGKDGGVGDLVAVEVKDRQDDAVRERVHELVRLPAGGKRAGLGLAVAHHGNREHAGVVENGAVGVGEHVAKLAALVDGARGLGRVVAGDAAGVGELAEELLEAGLVIGDVGTNLAVGAVEQRLRGAGRSAVAGAHKEDGVLLVVADEAVHVAKEEVQAGRGAPVANEAVLDVLTGEAVGAVLVLEVRAHEGVGAQINLANGQVVGATPVLVDPRDLVLAHRAVELLPGSSQHRLSHSLSSH